MPPDAPSDAIHDLADHLFRHESARLTASLVRALGVRHLDLAQDVVQDALLTALRVWSFRGIPDNPAAWLTQVARRRAIDLLRRDARLRDAAPALAAWAARPHPPADSAHELDEQLALMFACAHPALAQDARVALTLNVVAAFSALEIARAFLITPDAAAQRLVRAKRLIRDQNLALEVPDESALPARLDPVLETLYLMLNEGHSACAGADLVRRDVVDESARLAGLLLQHPRTALPAVHALQALILFTASRLNTRTDPEGSLLLLDEQDRSLWDHALIQKGFHHLMHSAAGDTLSRYHVEAAIAAVHARAPSFDLTDWPEIVGLYDLLLRVNPSPVVELNRAVAVAMALGPDAGLAALDSVARDPRLASYAPLSAARGEILARAARPRDAALHFRAALALSLSDPQRQLLLRRLAKAQADADQHRASL